jgi:CO/xanthine dehydrogenase Mo-binding subunit
MKYYHQGPFMQEIIGKSGNRIDAAAKVTGAAQYPGDINLPHQTHMKMVFSSRAHHAGMISK